MPWNSRARGSPMIQTASTPTVASAATMSAGRTAITPSATSLRLSASARDGASAASRKVRRSAPERSLRHAGEPRARSKPRRVLRDVTQDLASRPAEDPLLVRIRDVERLDARNGAVDRAKEVRIVAAHDEVFGADLVASEGERRRAE